MCGCELEPFCNSNAKNGCDESRGAAKKSCPADATDYGASQRASNAADETYGGSDTDMTAQLTNIRGTDGIQAILNFGFGQGPAIVTRNYAQLGVDLPFYQSHGVASDGFLELAGDSAEGLRLPASPLLVPASLPDSNPQKLIVEAYKSEYEARWNAKVSTFGAYAYDGLMLAVEAIEKAGTTDKAAVRNALENIQGHVGVTGAYNMSCR